MGQDKRRVQWHNEGQLRVTVWTNRKYLKREMGENTQDGTLWSWFKITVPCGRKYDKTWLMDSTQSHCSVPNTPVDFHYVQNSARFFVHEASAASALKDVSYKICDEENQKIPIFVNTSAVPYSVRDKLEPEKMEQLKLAMSKQYDASQKALDLQLLRYDPGTPDSSNSRADLVHHYVDTVLNRRNCMAATLQITEENFPEFLSLNLHSNRLWQLDVLSDIVQMTPTVKILNLSRNEVKLTWELDEIKVLKVEEQRLEGNPLCDTFLDQPTFNGQDLPPLTTVDIDRPYLIKPLIKESCKGPDVLKSQGLQFLQQYYLIYNSGHRQSLLGAYHDEACFSLTIPFIPDNPAP